MIKLENLLEKPILSKKEKEINFLTEEKILNNISEEIKEEDETEVRFEEFLALVDKAAAATSGLKKIIEQTQEKEIIPASEKEKMAIKKELGIDSDVITFEIYQKALSVREEIFMSKLRKKLLDEQIN